MDAELTETGRDPPRHRRSRASPLRGVEGELTRGCALGPRLGHRLVVGPLPPVANLAALGAQGDVRASCHSRIVRRKLWFGIKMLCSSSPPVSGLVDLVASQRSIADRSYDCPSAATTGSTMTSVVIGQMKSAGGSSSSFATGASAADGEPPSVAATSVRFSTTVLAGAEQEGPAHNPWSTHPLHISRTALCA